MLKNKKNKKGIMYSTNPNFEFEFENENIESISNKMQLLKVCIDKHRAGKIAIIIKEFVGSSSDLILLCKLLKKKCGVGGSAKNGEIIIQGNIRDQVIQILTKEGYKSKRVGG